MGWFERIIGRNRQKERDTPPGTALRTDGLALQPSVSASASLVVPSFAVDDRIAEVYRVKRVIEGGMATVYICHHERWNIDLVVKTPQAKDLANPEYARRFVMEAEAWTELGLHPHIAYCYYVHPLAEVPLLVVEYLDGGTLEDWIADGKCADLKVGLDLAIQCCHGLEHAHSRGMIHRDIKPKNILLAQDGTLKITDFGIVRASTAQMNAPLGAPVQAGNSPSPEAGVTVFAGTPEYMPLEQLIDPHGVDERADIFAFGVCLYEMFCGRRPYSSAVGPRQEAPDPRKVRGDAALPERLCSLLMRCVDWDRERRLGSVREIRQELCGIYENLFHQPSVWAELPEISLKADEFNNRGVTYLELGREEDAVKCWQEALKEDPAHLEANFNYGYWRRRKGEIADDTYVATMQALEKNEGANPDYWRCLAWIHLQRGDLEAIEKIQQSPYRLEDEDFKKALEDPKRPIGKLLRILTGHTDSVVRSVSFSPDGRHIVSGSEDRTLRLWEMKSGQEVRCFTGHTNRVYSVSFSPDGRYIVSGSSYETLRLWEVAYSRARRPIHFYPLLSRVKLIVKMRQEQEQLAELLQSASTHVEKQAFREAYQVLRRGQSLAENARDGEVLDLLARCGEEGQGKRVGVKGAWALLPLTGHTRVVTAVSFSPDGRHIVSGSEDTTLRLWEMKSGQEVRCFTGHTNLVMSVSFSPDGRYIVSGSADTTLRLWEVASGQEVRCFTGHTNLVMSVSFSPDGRHIVSGSEDTTLRLWEMKSGQ
ncbi:MAG: protein kinase, partial [Deltaproteobacteria bacterium]|nr:protein kinase [Deltaproteobacteria bacterium]